MSYDQHAHIRRLRTALAFYANKRNYDPQTASHSTHHEPEESAVSMDDGDKARAALAGRDEILRPHWIVNPHDDHQFIAWATSPAAAAKEHIVDVNLDPDEYIIVPIQPGRTMELTDEEAQAEGWTAAECVRIGKLANDIHDRIDD